MRARLWFALLAPPTAWFAALNAGYFTVSWACTSAAGRLALHAALLAMLALCASAGVVAVGERRAAAATAVEGVRRARFLPDLAVAAAALFALVIVVQWVAVVAIDPCPPGPRPRFAPSASTGAESGGPLPGRFPPEAPALHHASMSES